MQEIAEVPVCHCLQSYPEFETETLNQDFYHGHLSIIGINLMVADWRFYDYYPWKKIGNNRVELAILFKSREMTNGLLSREDACCIMGL